MPMQKHQIVQTALDILDRDGLEGVTLRRLANELHVKAASIYWHIANKEVLLDEMANAILEAHFGALDFENEQRDWAAWLDTLAHELRAAMLAYREGARVVAGAHLGIAVMLAKLLGLTIHVLHNAGFSYSQAATITVTMTTFTFGFVIEEQASPPLVHVPAMYLDKQIPIGPFRTLGEAMNAWKDENENNDTRFDTGVRIIINGVRAEQPSSGTAGNPA
ncbi:MAG TPA: TetR/AcrR family transcriptional regulator C-terminal domain-containing protein [Roseiflexaceae bacterium]|nr:TetR/AcrR family transcriptional regulator C-terminal domain-containing protein [Roseiflexaceae bacterium]